MIPEPGTQEFEKMIDFMRKDLDSGMAYSKLIQATKEMFEKQGRDFNAEFEKWKEKL
jgi:hypothetical protein